MIRRAILKDAKAIHAAHMKSIREVCSRDYTPQEILAWGGRPFNEEKWSLSIKNDFVWVLELNNRIEGYGHLRISERHRRKVAALMGLYITPAAIGKKWGQCLLEVMLAEGKKQEVTMIHLESTLTAHRFYQKFGFVDVGPQITVEIGGVPIRCIPMSQELAKPHSLPPVLETKRLILRPIGPKDFPSYQKNFNDYEIIRYLAAHVPWPYPENGVEEFYKNILLPKQGRDYWHWGIFLKSSPDETIGAVDLWRGGSMDNRGFWLARKYWGQGFMTEVAARINDHAFKDLGFEVLYFGNAVTNLGSKKIKEKTGATHIGTRPFKYVDPNLHESDIWKLTKEDWEKFRI